MRAQMGFNSEIITLGGTKMIGKTHNNEYYFRASYYDEVTGKRIRKYQTGFATKKEARIQEQNFLNQPREEDHKFLTLKDVAYDYLNHRMPYIELTSHFNNQRIFDTYILHHFKNKLIHDITKLDCRKFIDKLANYNRSTKTKNDILTLMKAAFNHAEEYFDLKNNPARHLKRLPKTIEDSKQSNIWTIDEFNSFISFFDLGDTEEHRWATFYTVAFWTGMRRGELLALTFNDIDIINKQLSITKSVTQKRTGLGVQIKSPKTRSSIRKISVDNKTLDMLQNEYELRSKEMGFNSDQFIFCRTNQPYVPFSDTTIETKKRIVIKKLKLKYIRFHDFRHSHASILIGNGVDIVSVSARLGHSSVDMTLKVYTHLLPSAERKALITINNLR